VGQSHFVVAETKQVRAHCGRRYIVYLLQSVNVIILWGEKTVRVRVGVCARVCYRENDKKENTNTIFENGRPRVEENETVQSIGGRGGVGERVRRL